MYTSQLNTLDCISIRVLLTLSTAFNVPFTPWSAESLNTKAAMTNPLKEREEYFLQRC